MGQSRRYPWMILKDWRLYKNTRLCENLNFKCFSFHLIGGAMTMTRVSVAIQMALLFLYMLIRQKYRPILWQGLHINNRKIVTRLPNVILIISKLSHSIHYLHTNSPLYSFLWKIIYFQKLVSLYILIIKLSIIIWIH